MEDNDWDLDKGSILVDIRNEEWPLIISFAGLGDKFQFRTSLKDLEVNVIYIRDLKHNWYLNGIPGVGTNIDEITKFLKGILLQHNARRVITMGASAGGFAAILYGCLLGTSSIVAFSPQTFMDRFHRVIYFDYRWKDRFQQIYEGDLGNRRYLDLKPLIRSFDGEIALFYDVNHRLDKLHVKRIKGKHIEYFPSTGGGHSLVRELKSLGKLDEHLRKVLSTYRLEFKG